MELTTIVGNLLGAIDADNIEVKALELAGMESGETGEEFRRTAREQLVGKATAVFTGGLIELIDRIRRDKEQTIDHDTLDKLLRAEWDKDAAVNAKALVDEFAAYLTEQQDRIEALKIFFSQPFRRRDITFAMVKELLERLNSDRPKLAPLRVWQAYGQLDGYQGAHPIAELSALVALIRRVCGMDRWAWAIRMTDVGAFREPPRCEPPPVELSREWIADDNGSNRAFRDCTVHERAVHEPPLRTPKTIGQG